MNTIKNPKTYINTFANYRIQLKAMNPPRDLSDEEASTAFMRGLKKWKYL